MVEIIWLSENSGCVTLRNRLHEEPMPDFLYTIGRKSPNYPVPALPMKIRIGKPWVFTFEWTIQYPTHEEPKVYYDGQ